MPSRNLTDGTRQQDRGLIGKNNPIALKLVRLLAELAVQRTLETENNLYEKPEFGLEGSNSGPATPILKPKAANNGQK